MSEIDDIMAAAVGTVTAAVPELTGYPHIVPKIVAPAVMAFPADRVSYGESFDDDGTLWFTLRLYVSREDLLGAQTSLNAYISRTGARSAIAALRASPRLGGVVADARVVEAANYGDWPVGQTTYLGVELRIQAMLG